MIADKESLSNIRRVRRLDKLSEICKDYGKFINNQIIKTKYQQKRKEVNRF